MSKRPPDRLWRTVGPCVVCGDIEPYQGGQRCHRCYSWWARHGKQAERPATVDLWGTVQPCRSCGDPTRNTGHGLCAPCRQWGRSHGKQWDVPADRPRAGRHQAAIAMKSPRERVASRRACKQCGQHIGPNPPSYQELCRRCSKQWWAAEQAAQDGRATKLYANPTSHPTRLAADPGMVEQQVRTEQGA